MRVARELIEKRAHQELSLRGRRNKREQRRGELGESYLKAGRGGGFSSAGVSRPAQLHNSGQLKQKEKETNLALPLFNYHSLIVTADQLHERLCCNESPLAASVH